ncbi:MAG: choice-of-anchor B family protein [Acidobacteria bacterium]|nr:choice-of-anchor B family protein [Acidobacteriota bacterium]
MPLSDIGGGTGNDVWGWTDPVTKKEHALMGRSTGTSFVDISDPGRPVYLGNLPTHTVESAWRGIKVSGNYAFIVSEASAHGMQIFDLTQLRNVTVPTTFSETAHYSGFGSAHTPAINESTGFAYAAGSNTCSGGLHMVNIQTPTAPVFAGCVSGDGYSHETQCVLYDGPDGRYATRELCFSSNTDTLTIIDVTNKAAPAQLSRTGYANSGYAHQGWLTEDHRYFLMDDELDEQRLSSNTRTIVWDVSTVTAPFVAGVYEGPSTAIDHNLSIRGQLAYEANYRSGLRIVDITNVATASLSEVAYFDIYPVDDALGYNGAWSNYPYFASGIVIVSGIEQGLFVLRPAIPDATQADVSVSINDAPDPVSVGQNITYTIGVSNSGLADATSVTLSTALSLDVSLVSTSPSQGTCSGSDTVVCALGNIANAGSASVTIVVRADNAGTVGTTASVSASQSDPSLANNSATATTTVSAQASDTTMHVGDLDAATRSIGKQNWQATVTIAVHDAAHNLLAGAVVSGEWSGGFSGARTCTTDSGGQQHDHGDQAIIGRMQRADTSAAHRVAVRRLYVTAPSRLRYDCRVTTLSGITCVCAATLAAALLATTTALPRAADAEADVLDRLRDPRPYTIVEAQLFQQLGWALPDGGAAVKRLADAAPGSAFDPRALEKLSPKVLGYRATWHVVRYPHYGLEWDITGLLLTPNAPVAGLPTVAFINGGSANWYEFFVDPLNGPAVGQYLAQRVPVFLISIPGWNDDAAGERNRESAGRRYPPLAALRSRTVAEYSRSYIGPLNPLGPGTPLEIAQRWFAREERRRPQFKQVLQDIEHQGETQRREETIQQIRAALNPAKLPVDPEAVIADLFSTTKTPLDGYRRMIWTTAKRDDGHWDEDPERARELFVARAFQKANPDAQVRVLVFDVPMSHYGHIEQPRQLAGGILAAVRWLYVDR